MYRYVPSMIRCARPRWFLSLNELGEHFSMRSTESAIIHHDSRTKCVATTNARKTFPIQPTDTPAKQDTAARQRPCRITMRNATKYVNQGTLESTRLSFTGKKRA